MATRPELRERSQRRARILAAEMAEGRVALRAQAARHAPSPADAEDESADLSNWTASNSEVASCGAGERLLSGGIVFTNLGNRRVGVIESLPFSNSSSNGFIGRITSDSGGTAAAEVQAICLK
jgi:hypothetical protein